MQISETTFIQVTLFGPPPDPSFINVDVYIMGRSEFAGLCGTPDGIEENEWLDRKTGKLWPMEGNLMPKDVSDSWRYV
jgi:hypothetical protein